MNAGEFIALLDGAAQEARILQPVSPPLNVAELGFFCCSR